MTFRSDEERFAWDEFAKAAMGAIIRKSPLHESASLSETEMDRHIYSVANGAASYADHLINLRRNRC